MPTPPLSDDIALQAWQAYVAHGSKTKAAQALGWNRNTFDHRWHVARERGFHLSEGAQQAVSRVKLSGIEAKGGWIHDYDADGKKVGTVRWSATEPGPDDFRDVLAEALCDIKRLPPIDAPERTVKGLANFFPIADLHFGGEYGRPEYEIECRDTMDRLFAGMPRAEKSFVIDLGDTTDANDHKGVTPASGNPCDVIRHGMLGVTRVALNFLKHVTYRALETSDEVETHVQRGNHSETAYIAILLGLAEHFADNPRVKIAETDEMYRILRWGKCGVLPDHGDRMKWADLKDVWTVKFAKDWAECEAYRGIWTAHFHHDKMRDLPGVECRHFRTMAAPSHWQKSRFPPMPRSACAITLHQEEGFDGLIQRKLRQA